MVQMYWRWFDQVCIIPYYDKVTHMVGKSQSIFGEKLEQQERQRELKRAVAEAKMIPACIQRCVVNHTILVIIITLTICSYSLDWLYLCWESHVACYWKQLHVARYITTTKEEWPLCQSSILWHGYSDVHTCRWWCRCIYATACRGFDQDSQWLVALAVIRMLLHEYSSKLLVMMFWWYVYSVHWRNTWLLKESMKVSCVDHIWRQCFEITMTSKTHVLNLNKSFVMILLVQYKLHSSWKV